MITYLNVQGNIETHMSIYYYLQKIVSQLVYPVKESNWYREKKYNSFEDFISVQQGNDPERESIFPDMKYLNSNRKKVTALMTNGNQVELDTVTFAPKDNEVENNTINEKKPGHGKHIIYFFGRNEPLEVKWREISNDAHNIGATCHAFNLPGMGQSTGKMIEFNDAVNSGIAQVNELLKQGIKPEDIILKGNCFGASVATEVQHHCSINVDNPVNIRLINSNSYRILRDVVLEAVPFLLKFFMQFVSLLDYTGWNPKTEEKVIANNPYVLIVHRDGDKTIGKQAKLQTAVEEHKDALIADGLSKTSLQIPGYEESQEFFDKHNTMYLKEEYKNKDSHIVQMNYLEWIDQNGEKRPAWELFAEYISRSNEYFQKKPELSSEKQGQKDIELNISKSYIQSLNAMKEPDISREEKAEHTKLIKTILNADLEELKDMKREKKMFLNSGTREL